MADSLAPEQVGGAGGVADGPERSITKGLKPMDRAGHAATMAIQHRQLIQATALQQPS